MFSHVLRVNNLSYLILVFWAFHIARRIFFYLYFWQKKEYRLDRFIEEIKRRNKIIFSRSFFFALILVIFLLFIQKNIFWFSLFFSFYFFFGLSSLYLFLKNHWRFPKFTLKQIILTFSSFLLIAFLFYIFFSKVFLFILLLEIFLPIIISFLIGLIQLPVLLAKKMIQNKAKKKIKKFYNLTVIGIAGSYGKTSVKEILYVFLSQKYNVLKTRGNNNTEIGVSSTILKNLKKEHQIFIAEVGAYKKGEIKNICQIIMPEIGILTGINEQHLALFGSQENIIKAKFEIVENLKENGTAILNGYNKYIRENIKNKKIIAKKIIIGNDIWAEEVKEKKEFIFFKVRTKKGDFIDFKINILGKQNVENLLLAIAAAKEIGMSLEEISKACLEIKPNLGGIKILKRTNPRILDSSYSANPTGVIADLDYLKIYKEKRVVIMPCLIELGEKAREVHREIGKKISETADLLIVTTKDYFLELKNSALRQGMEEKNIILIEDKNKIINKIKSLPKESVILLEGRTPGLKEKITKEFLY